MNDPWARPADGGEFVEIELVETGSEAGRVRRAADTDDDDVPHRPGRARWLVGAAIVIGVGAGAVALSGDDMESAATSDTMFDTSQITTPPTLPSLVTVPPATLPLEAEQAIEVDPRADDRDGATDGDEERLDPTSVTVPEFPVIAELDPDGIDGYDLLAAAAANTAVETGKRTTVALNGVQLDGLYSSTAVLVVISDPVAERDSLTVEWNVGEPAVIITDRATDTVYRTDARLEGRWEQFSSSRFTDGTGTDDLGELFDAFVTGPITPRTLAASKIDTIVDLVELVELQGGVLARPYTVITPIEALVPYGVLLLANVYDGPVADGLAPDVITFTVYVTEGSELALVTARFDANATAFALEQTFGPPATDVSIDLPPLDLLIPNAPRPTAPSTAP